MWAARCANGTSMVDQVHVECIDAIAVTVEMCLKRLVCALGRRTIVDQTDAASHAVDVCINRQCRHSEAEEQDA